MGKVLFYSNRDGDGDLYILDSDGKSLQNLTSNDVADGSPSVSPFKKYVVYITRADEDEHGYVIMDFDGKLLYNVNDHIPGAFPAGWSPDSNYLVLGEDFKGEQRQRQFWVLNVRTGAVTKSGIGCWCKWSPDSSMVAYYTCGTTTQLSVYRVDRSTELTLGSNLNRDFDWSPDGRSLLFTTSRDGNYEIYLANAVNGGLINITAHASGDVYPKWSPDGRQFAFVSDRNGAAALYTAGIDGQNIRKLAVLPSIQTDMRWSPDGTCIAYLASTSDTLVLHVINIADGTTWQVPMEYNMRKTVEEGLFRWSPDSQYLTYSSGANWDLYLVDRGSAQAIRITNNKSIIGSRDYAWSADSQSIVFTSDQSGNFEVYIYHVDSRELTNVNNSPGKEVNPAWVE